MKRAGICLAGALALLLGGALWLRNTLRTDTAPASAEVPPSTAPAPELPTQPASRVTTASRPQSARQVERSAVLGDDPEYRRHLAGFTGRVVTSAGALVAGCPVRIHEFDPARSFVTRTSVFEAARPELDVDVGSTETDAGGRYRIDGAEPLARFLLVAGDGNARPFTLQTIQRTPSPGELVDLGDLVLRDGVTLRGRVVDERGAPIANALVRAAELAPEVLALAPFERFEPDGNVIARADHEGAPGLVLDLPAWVATRWDALPVARTRSGSDGTFTLTAVPAGSIAFAITCTGKASLVEPSLQTGADRDLGDLVVTDGVTARGRVVGPDGRPCAGAELLIAPTSAGLTFDFAAGSLRSDAQGNFLRSGFPRGHVTVACRREARDPWTVVEPSSVTSDLLITLPGTANLTLRLEGPDVTSLVGVDVRVFPRPDRREWLRADLVPEVALAHRREPLGLDAVRFRELAFGTYLVVAKAKGSTTLATFVDLTGDREVTLTFRRTRDLLVRVFDDAGAPVKGARVHAVWESSSRGGSELEAARFRAELGQLGSTNAAGTLVVEVPEGAGSATFRARHLGLGFAQAQVDLPTPELALRLAQPGRLEGTLTENTALPRPGNWLVEVTRRTAGERNAGAALDVPRLAVPDALGHFAVAALPEGEYFASARPSLAHAGSLEDLAAAVRTRDERLTWLPFGRTAFRITSSTTTSITLEAELQRATAEGPGAHLTGIATLDDSPAMGLIVRNPSRPDERAKIDALGRFDFGRVAPGMHPLELVDPHAADASREVLWSERVDVRADEDRALEIRLHTATLEGTVLDPDGTPAADVEVSAGPSPHERTTTDRAGRFHFEHLAPGTRDLTALRRDEARGSEDGIVLAPGRPIPGITVRLRRMFRIHGKVDLALLGPLRMERITGRFLDEAATWASGTCEIDRASGAFRSPGLLPGSYRIEVTTLTGTFVGTAPVLLGTTDRTGVLCAIEQK